MVNKEEWTQLDKLARQQKIISCLDELISIENRTHILSSTRKEGILSLYRKNLEQFILNTVTWETNEENI